MPSVSIDSTVFFRKLKKAKENNVDRIVMKRAAEFGKTRIKQRTKKGGDYSGSPFTPYSEQTEQYKEDKGKSPDLVTLFDFGNMLAAMTSRVQSRKQSIITFASQAERKKALRHMEGTKKLPQREFFRLSKDDEKRIVEMIDDYVESKMIRRFNRGI